jgi:hypothetical protein
MRRPKQHWQMKQELAYKSPKTSWVKSVLAREEVPEVVVLETCKTPEELAEAEKFWIEYFKSIGARLTNMTAGGTGGGTRWSEETRRRHEQSYQDPVARARRSAGHSGKRQAPETVKKRAQTIQERFGDAAFHWKDGRPHTEEHKAKISAAHSTPEMIEFHKQLTARRLEARGGMGFASGSKWPEASRKARSIYLLKGKKIACSNGKIYETQKDAVADTGALSSSISRVCNGRGKTANNLKFWWVT